MRIATVLGKSLREVEALDADEILWWEALFAVDPPGDQRMDMRFAMLCQTIAALFGKPPPLTAFMLFPDKAPQHEPISSDGINEVMQQVSGWMQHGDNDRKT